MRSSLVQHFFGLMVIVIFLPLCAAAFLLAAPYLCFRSHPGSIPRPNKSLIKHTFERGGEGEGASSLE
jgi:hypothetical protein